MLIAVKVRGFWVLVLFKTHHFYFEHNFPCILCHFLHLLSYFIFKSLFFTFWCFACMLTSLLYLVSPLPRNLLPHLQNDFPFTVRWTLNHYLLTALSQRVSELINRPICQAELEHTLIPSNPDTPIQTIKRELKIMEFIKKKDFRAAVLSAPGR